MEIVDAFRDYFKDKSVGFEFSCSDLKKVMIKDYGLKKDSIIPSDFCYNRTNDGINWERQPHFFKYLSRNRYKYVGERFSFSGEIIHRPLGGQEKVFGNVVNGELIRAY